MGWLSILTAVIFAFLVSELVRSVFFTKDWRFRLKSNAEPLENWKKALLIMGFFIILFPLVNLFFVNYVSLLIELLGWYQISLLLMLLPTTFLWIQKRILSLPWTKTDWILVGLIFLILLISFLI